MNVKWFIHSSKHFKFIAIAIFLCYNLSSCGDSLYDCGEETISLIHKNLTPSKEKNSADNKTHLNIYIDFSNGMHSALNQTSDLFYRILDAVDEPDTRYYRIGATSNPQAVVKAQLNNEYNTRDVSSFSDNRSELDVAIEKIISNNQYALFITDFELAKTGKSSPQRTNDGRIVDTYISLDSWALKSFDIWLQKSNNIQIYAKEFIKNDNSTNGAQSQYLYFILFTPHYAANTQHYKNFSNYLTSIVGEYNIEYFNFSKSNYNLSLDYENSTQLGVVDAILSNCATVEQGKKYEYYQLSFSEIMDYIVLDDDVVDKQFIAGPKIENHTNFKELSFDSKTFDITELYAEAFDSIAIGGNINFNKNKVLPKERLFNLIYKDNQLGFKLDEDFTMMENDRGVYKIDIYIKGDNIELDKNRIDNVLRWRDTKGDFYVEGLSSSIKEAARRMKIESTLLYTYYIELVN